MLTYSVHAYVHILSTHMLAYAHAYTHTHKHMLIHSTHTHTHIHVWQGDLSGSLVIEILEAISVVWFRKMLPLEENGRQSPGHGFYN